MYKPDGADSIISSRHCRIFQTLNKYDDQQRIFLFAILFLELSIFI